MTEQAIKSAAKLLREMFFKILRKEIERTMGRPEEIDEEIRHLTRNMMVIPKPDEKLREVGWSGR